MKSLLHNGFRLVAVIAIALSLLAGATTAKAETVVCDNPCDSAALTAAIVKSVAGDVIEVPAGTFPLATEVIVNKDVTIHGAGEGVTIFEVSGTGRRITMSASGASLENFEIYKTDKTAQSPIISIAADNLTLSNITVHGQWKMGDGETVRALVTNVGKKGLLVEDSSFYNLRQPGYVDTNTGVIIRDTFVAATRGWVVDDAEITFTGNTWGTGTEVNAVDIAIIPDTTASYYPDILAISAANNDAVIEDQRKGVATHVWVDVNTPHPVIDQKGYQPYPFPSIQTGIDRTVSGGKLFIADGTYLETGTAEADLTINRSINVIGAGEEATLVRLTAGKNYGLKVNPANLETPASVSISGMGFLPRDGSDVGPNNGIAFGTSDGHFTEITIDSVTVEGSKTANVWLGNYSTYGDVTLVDSEFSNSKRFGVDLSSTIQSLEIDGCVFAHNGDLEAVWGGGLYTAYAAIEKASIRNSEFDANVSFGIFAGELHDTVIDSINVHDIPASFEPSAVNLYVPPGKNTSNVQITNSEFTNNKAGGFSMYGDGTSTANNITITGNVYKDNLYSGVSIFTGPKYTGVNIHHNVILVPDTSYAVYNGWHEQDVTAADNWLGCNEGPNQPGCGKIEGVDDATWLVLETSAAEEEVLPNASTAITASLKKNNLGEDRSALGTLPVDSDVAFTSESGKVSPTSDPVVDYEAQTTFTAGIAGGNVEVCAALHNEQDCIDVKVTNLAPEASADQYTMKQHDTLTIDVPGVMANDTDGNNDALTAELVDDVTNGDLTLNDDGSFTYIPKLWWYGEDTFSYRASDGSLESEVVTVTITVENIFTNIQYLPLIFFQP